MPVPSDFVPHLKTPVSKIVMGTDWLAGARASDYFAALDAYWAAGGRTFDTAYGYGANTNLLAAWIHARGVRNEAVFFDKGCHPSWDHKTQSLIKRVSYEATKHELAENHRRLDVEYTHFFTFHRDDEDVPVSEIIDWMNEIVASGKIGAFGGSNWRHQRIAEANAYAEKSGKQGFSLNNPNLTLAENVKPLWSDCITIGEEGRQWHEETKMPLFSWSSTARGYFARVDDEHVNGSYDSPTSQARRDRAEQLGKELGASAVQIALAWVLNQPFPTFALCGMRNVDQVRENVDAAEIKLSPEQVRWLENGD